MMKEFDLLYIQVLTVWSLIARGSNKEVWEVGNPGKVLELGARVVDNN